MLVLSRKVGEEVVINDRVRLVVVAVRANRIILGVKAPETVSVRRAELPPRK